jgi:excisionase family DNA binding protein
MPATDSDLLTVQQVSDLINVKVGTLRGWRFNHQGPSSFSLGGLVRYRRADVEAWVEAQIARTTVGDQNPARRPKTGRP